MNAVTTIQQPGDGALVDVMRASLYPGARPESVGMVLAYCRARGLDPLRKPVHIVPMWVTPAGSKQGAMQDVVMPGIALYRIEAARTGAYAGKTEPEFGPDRTEELEGSKVTFPEWCKITVYRTVNGERCAFVAKEYWLENYATKSRDSDQPNAMWRKRAYGQLAKCAEAQALRMAFPEETGGEPTGEEMEGKVHAPREVQSVVVETSPAAAPAIAPPQPEKWPLLGPDNTLYQVAPSNWLTKIGGALARLESVDAVRAWREAMAPHMEKIGGDDPVRVSEADHLIEQRLAELDGAASADDDFPGDGTR
jgi:phage recombination protein Bet